MKKYFLYIIMISISIFLIYEGLILQKRNNYNINIIKERILYYNILVNKNDGLYKDKDTYYFKGEKVNNYLKIFNRIYRIVSFTNKEIKIISNKNEAVFFYGKNNKFENSNINIWLNKTSNDNTGVYFDSINNIDKYLIKKNNEKYFSILNYQMYKNSGADKGYLNNGESSFIIDNLNNVKIKGENGKVKDNVGYNTASGIRVVFDLKSNLKVVKGQGTYNNPFIIEDNDNKYINRYVKLENDMYQIFFDKNGILKLRSNTVLNKKINFTSEYSKFNPLNKNNIAYYLNNEYYNTLTYKKYLKECSFQTGEVMDNYNYLDIYKSKISVKVGLINIFDLNISNFLDGYYLVNTSKNSSNIAFRYNKFGDIVGDNSYDINKILPVVCISKSDIIKGSGTLKNPYILE